MCINIIDRLKKKGFIDKITNELDLLKQITTNNITLYCGFDPTADSLHIGHLLPLLCLKHFQISGHKPIILIGGATSLIGDPSFKQQERLINLKQNVHEWENKIIKQVSLFLDFDCIVNKAIIVNNYEWLSKLNVIQFLCNIGRCFSVNSMINKKSVRERIKRLEQGISFTEFSYTLLQAYDFCFLYKKYNAILQIGGSDQWGNISSGINLNYKLNRKKVYGLTIPLLTNSSGGKFGKTAQGTIWLDKNKTSIYKFYQFWINLPDNEILRYLNLFTLLKEKEIKDIQIEKDKLYNIFHMRKILAEKVTFLVHGREGLSIAKRITNCLFSKKIYDVKESDFEQLVRDGMFFIQLKGQENLIDTLVLSSLAPSKNQARIMISSKSVRINNKVQENVKYVFKSSDKLFFKFTLLSRGKKNYCLLCW